MGIETMNRVMFQVEINPMKTEAGRNGYHGDAAAHSWAEGLVASTRAGKFRVVSGQSRVIVEVDAEETDWIELQLDADDMVVSAYRRS